MNRIVLSALALICAAVSAHGRDLSPDDLARHTGERRAVAAVIWGMPVVDNDLTRGAPHSQLAGLISRTDAMRPD